MSTESRWSQEEAGLLTMLATNQEALSLSGLLLRIDRLVPDLSWEQLVDSLGRLVAAGLVIWSERRFFASATGRAISPGGEGRYFVDLFEETRAALNDQVPRPEPADLGVTRVAFDEALAEVAEVKDRHRTRRGVTGYKKWAEWWDAPPLGLADCLEFLTFSQGRPVVVLMETGDDSVRVEGKIGLPNPGTLSRSNEQPIAFPILVEGSDSPPIHLTLSADHFVSAEYRSNDGVDYFTMTITFDDGRSIALTDTNAPAF